RRWSGGDDEEGGRLRLSGGGRRRRVEARDIVDRIDRVDARPEGENSEKRQKTSDHGTQEQLDAFDAWMEDAGTYDDEVPDDKISHELVEEMSGEIDEAKLQKDVNEMLRQRSGKRLPFSNPKKKAPVVQSCQRDPKAPLLTLKNQDLFYLKHGNLGPKKYILSLNKFPAVPFPDDDIEERTSRTTYELGHEHKFITEIIIRRAIEKIDPITKPDYKYLNKNDIKDIATIIWERVYDFQLGMESYQQKVNLTAPTITFPGIEECKVFDITSELVCGMIYENS
ncbi:hypothetical protein Tco_1025950, partial [Tanacetum coccineum]